MNMCTPSFILWSAVSSRRLLLFDRGDHEVLRVVERSGKDVRKARECGERCPSG
jgi:hypothetical protein